MSKGYSSRVEICENKVMFTVFSPRHGECGVPDSRTGFGNTIDEAINNCEWSCYVNIKNTEVSND